VEYCTDHANLDKWYTRVATKALLWAMSKVLWGYRVLVIPPCVEQDMLQQRALAALKPDADPQTWN